MPFPLSFTEGLGRDRESFVGASHVLAEEEFGLSACKKAYCPPRRGIPPPGHPLALTTGPWRDIKPLGTLTGGLSGRVWAFPG
jgi:hypothetical protein